MKIEIEKITWNENQDELAVLLNQLPKWRLEKALSYYFDIDKYLCAKSFLLLQKMLFKEYNLTTIPQFSYTKNGKPYFKEFPEIYFNISHCKLGISWWLYEDVEKVITIKENGKEQKIDITDIKDFWKFLEDGRNEKIKAGTYVEI